MYRLRHFESMVKQTYYTITTKDDEFFIDIRSIDTILLFKGIKYIPDMDIGKDVFNIIKKTSVIHKSFESLFGFSMAGMFKNCTSLTTINISGWNTTQMTSMSGMFNNFGTTPKKLK